MSDNRPQDFQPNSLDATLARILAAQDELNRKADRIVAQVELTNGRVKGLEIWREVVKGQTVMLASLISAFVGAIGWAVNQFLNK